MVKPMVVAFVLLEVDDATLGNEILEQLHSFREVKLGCGVSPKFNLLVLCLV